MSGVLLCVRDTSVAGPVLRGRAEWCLALNYGCTRNTLIASITQPLKSPSSLCVFSLSNTAIANVVIGRIGIAEQYSISERAYAEWREHEDAYEMQERNVEGLRPLH